MHCLKCCSLKFGFCGFFALLIMPLHSSFTNFQSLFIQAFMFPIGSLEKEEEDEEEDEVEDEEEEDKFE